MKKAAPDVLKELHRRKTFAIISHPDAGKTTITEKLLLFGDAIQMAGQVKAKRAKQFATSDWMEIEKQRGISVASSVMQFSYKDFAINLLDTPGHADFSEDTYRVLTAVDSALMAIDGAKGIETQTKKLFQVCRDRHVPILTFINKMDRDAKDPFDLIDEIEQVLGLHCAVMTWPIGMGDRFKGVYDRQGKCIRVFDPGEKTKSFKQDVFTDLDDPKLAARIGEEFVEKLKEDLELLEGAGHEFDVDTFLKGDVSPVYFGSALNNFGVQELLEAFVKYAPGPLARPAESRSVNPEEANFSGLVFKIQANMDPKHRDRCAFIRICSGVFEPGKNLYSPRLGRNVKLNNAVQFMSKERKNIDTAYAGDIIGIIDRGNLMIGDTLTEGEELKFTGIPQFSPDLFSLVDLKNPIKMKQLQKGVEQLAEEGTSQVFRRKYNSDTILGVVGRLQFEIVKYRLLNEYGADAIFTSLPYTASRWYRCENAKAKSEFEDYYQSGYFPSLEPTSDPRDVYDLKGFLSHPATQSLATLFPDYAWALLERRLQSLGFFRDDCHLQPSDFVDPDENFFIDLAAVYSNHSVLQLAMQVLYSESMGVVWKTWAINFCSRIDVQSGEITGKEIARDILYKYLRSRAKLTQVDRDTLFLMRFSLSYLDSISDGIISKERGLPVHDEVDYLKRYGDYPIFTIYEILDINLEDQQELAAAIIESDKTDFSAKAEALLFFAEIDHPQVEEACEIVAKQVKKEMGYPVFKKDLGPAIKAISVIAPYLLTDSVDED